MLLPLDSSLESFAFWQVPEPQKAQSQTHKRHKHQNVLYDLCFLWLAIIQIARDHFHHLNQHSAERLPETSRHTRVYLHSHCDSVLREVHHVRHVPREEAAVTV